MLQVRNAQLQAFREVELKLFIEKVVRKLERRYPSECDAMGDEALRGFVRDGIERARTCNVTKEGAVSILIELFLAFGEHLDRTPDAAWANQILNHPGLPDQLKVGMLEERLFGATAGRTVAMSPAAAQELDASAESTTS